MPLFDSVRFNAGRSLLSEVTADKLNAILAEIRRVRPRADGGITVRQSGDGTYIGLASVPTGGGSGVAAHPFRIVQGESANTIKVDPGTLNDTIATNWSSELSISSGLQYVILTASCSANKIASTALSVTSTPTGEATPTAWSVPTEFKVMLGMVDKTQDGTQIYQIVKNNLSYGVSKRITVNQGSPELPFTNYYTWAAQ